MPLNTSRLRRRNLSSSTIALSVRLDALEESLGAREPGLELLVGMLRTCKRAGVRAHIPLQVRR